MLYLVLPSDVSKSENKEVSLAMSYSHMGRPHTTIGAVSFHV